MTFYKLSTMLKSYGMSMLSRGLGVFGYSKRADPEIKKIRSLSCNGEADFLPPCEHRVVSDRYPRSYYCGACGCGDRKSVLVGGVVPEYSKLDYPYLACPISMPGFSNYVPSSQASESNHRKVNIEEAYGEAWLSSEAHEQQRGLRITLWGRKARKMLSANRTQTN